MAAGGSVTLDGLEASGFKVPCSRFKVEASPSAVGGPAGGELCSSAWSHQVDQVVHNIPGLRGVANYQQHKDNPTATLVPNIPG